MADELLLPQVPEPKPDDSEDVSWALSTAEAMWARGDHAEGIKWLRKAAEAASDAEHDVRALELAKAASDLASLLARRSAPEGGAVASPPVPAPTPKAPIAANPSSRPSASPGRPRAPRSSPPLPSRTSQPPAPTSSSPSKAPRPLSAAPKPQPSTPRQMPVAGSRADRKRRRSRENLEEEVRIGALPEPPHIEGERETSRDVATAAANDKTTEVPALQMQVPIERTFEGDAPSSRRRKSPADAGERRPSVPPRPSGPPSGGPSPEPPARPASEWDSSPTQALSSADLEEMAQVGAATGQVSDGDRMTSIGAPPLAVTTAAAAVQSPVRGPTKTIHDEGIQTSQAVRVVVWRDGNGVHVAPAGTVVSAITVDAVLVALEPSADLTAWLSRRDR